MTILSILVLGFPSAVLGQPLQIAHDHGVVWGGNGENGHHQEVGYESNGNFFFMLAQAGGGPWPGKGCPDPNPHYDCVSAPGDQIELLTAPNVTGPWEPFGGSLKTARITPCWDEAGFAIPTTWGVGSLWHHDTKWYLTVDAGHGGDGEKHYIYLITSTNGLDWEPITESKRIIDASGDEAHQNILYSTIIPTGGPKVGFFFWTGAGDNHPSNIGYGQIDLEPGGQDPNGVAVYLLDKDGLYRKLPEDGKVDFNVMKLWKSGRNPRPGDAYLINGLQGQLLVHSQHTDTTLDVCEQGVNRRTTVTELDWLNFELELDEFNRPKLKLCDDDEVEGFFEDKLCDQELKKIEPGGPVGNPLIDNPRNGNPGIIDPDVFFNPIDQKRYLFAAVEPNCSGKWGDLKIELFELN